ncbi:imidazolonepropionase-like amidohydrolase [Nitrospirillum amazonense]|uniref:Imidazolonepropionase-like amidohydrolase n=1 Tax=Nitrospirillum amazonense TaxID=28077 RepID=A0A560FPD6_9PROT|nr:amidohydrolase family protein [Nitrospirillum amazonense]TWB23486.1 imidazolonepropionase-like amidohydrolase [Nitrospirillum amazonense]
MRPFATLLRSALLVSSVLVPLMAAAQEARPAPEAVVIYRGATLIDGTGTAPRADMAVVTKGQDIALVVPAGQVPAELARGATVVDASGLYVLPGLIDTHVHLATVPNRKVEEALLRRAVYGGVTAERDMAGDTRALADLARSALLGEIPAPDIYYAALMAGLSFFKDPRTAASAKGATPGEVPWMQAITPATDLKVAVALARGTGASAIKIYANLPADLVAGITREAHAQGFRVWAHAMVFPATPAEEIEAGVDVLSHACMLAYQALPVKPTQYHDRAPVDPARIGNPDPLLAGLFDGMKHHGQVLDATVRVYAEGDKRWAGKPNPPGSYCPGDLAARITAQAHAAGVAVSAGTDGETPAADAYPALHEELELLVRQAGFTPLAAIQAGTQMGARALNLESRMGTVAAGKLANLVFVAKDPTQDIANLRSVVYTVKRGRRYNRTDFRPIAPDEAGDVD